MSAGNFSACWAVTRGFEGGFTKNPEDPGNWTRGAVGIGMLEGTNMGISAAAYPDLNIAMLTPFVAGAIYQRDYWNRVAGDALPAGVDMMVFDAAVNMGVWRSAELLQTAVGVTADGIIKTATLAAVKAMDAARLIDALAEAREAYYERLGTFQTFGDGWTARVTACRQAALAMAGAA